MSHLHSLWLSFSMGPWTQHGATPLRSMRWPRISASYKRVILTSYRSISKGWGPGVRKQHFKTWWTNIEDTKNRHTHWLDIFSSEMLRDVGNEWHVLNFGQLAGSVQIRVQVDWSKQAGWLFFHFQPYLSVPTLGCDSRYVSATNLLVLHVVTVTCC